MFIKSYPKRAINTLMASGLQDMNVIDYIEFHYNDHVYKNEPELLLDKVPTMRNIQMAERIVGYKKHIATKPYMFPLDDIYAKDGHLDVLVEMDIDYDAFGYITYKTRYTHNQQLYKLFFKTQDDVLAAKLLFK